MCSIYLNIITAVIESTIDKTVAQELFDLLISQTFLVAKRRLHIFVSIILHTMFYSNLIEWLIDWLISKISSMQNLFVWKIFYENICSWNFWNFLETYEAFQSYTYAQNKSSSGICPASFFLNMTLINSYQWKNTFLPELREKKIIMEKKIISNILLMQSWKAAEFKQNELKFDVLNSSK